MSEQLVMIPAELMAKVIVEARRSQGLGAPSLAEFFADMDTFAVRTGFALEYDPKVLAKTCNVTVGEARNAIEIDAMAIHFDIEPVPPME